ncbi:unnamed protein product [Kuraishia capsulata CBS 1993]|uniref:Elongator complex protein 1 n=1 Tax=Kuraishia capsulata CBS 1993 TaxID=1382522 RepID=W6MIJ8_9ASCO|nr:uncharacterized protein KUCA_T00001708001 [Kuraishia capsulata CBS 1993]CDK25738.1 unnamed protein product [Kuraishia capsulata CBS 1993]
MRNLTLLNKGRLEPVSRTYPDLKVVASVFNTVNDSITIALQGVDIIEVQQFVKDGSQNVLASFAIAENDRLLSFSEFSDLSQLIFAFEQGDIVIANYDAQSPDSDTTTVEIVGSIDCGLLAASWSYDEEIFALLTGERNLVLLSRTFEPVSEVFLNPEDVTISNQVSVGWGKKETQFKGRGVKALEREKLALTHAGVDFEKDPNLRDPTLRTLEAGELSSSDSFDCKISWRGDCEYLSISSVETVENSQRRVIRVYSRSGELDSCSEAVNGHEAALAWKPQGSLIASTQTTHVESIDYESGEHALEEVTNLIFFERNGLRHGEFNTRLPSGSIKDIAWSSTSEVLAFQLENSIQLWTTKNYHWSLKQEILTENMRSILFIKFHPEKPLQVMVGTEDVIEIFDLTYSIAAGPTAAPLDLGMIANIDGSEVGVTPLSVANVPPPISYRDIDFGHNINDVAVSSSNRIIGGISNNGVGFASFETDKWTPKTGKWLFPEDLHCKAGEFRQIALCNDDAIAAVLVDHGISSEILILEVSDLTKPIVKGSIDLGYKKCVLLKARSDFQAITYQTIDGQISEIDTQNMTASVVAGFPQLCSSYELIKSTSAYDWGSDVYFAFGLTSTGKLFALNQLLSGGVTSFLLTESHLIYTTAQHQLKFIHLAKKETFSSESDASPFQSSDDERTRMIERGSLLVTATPSSSAVILQAPRGNLETIYPRIMVMSKVRSDISRKKYKKAFLTCRIHRIDLDVLHDYNPELFLENIPQFIRELDSVEHLNLFVSCLHEEDVTVSKYKETLELSETSQVANELQELKLTESDKPELKQISKVNKICDAIVAILLKPEFKQKYLQTIITAYACQNPPNLEAAVRLISSFTDETDIDDSIEHLCFLQDVNKLYNIALGLYNIPVTLIIAQKSTKDPKEYLPFLQNLHVQTELRKKFLIDTHLKNYAKALDSLSKIGSDEDSEIDQEILDYVVEHSLYLHALSIYRYDSHKFDAILSAYAHYLHDQGNFIESALGFEQLGSYEDAMDNYVLAKKWKEAIAISLRPDLKEKRHAGVCETLVSSLTESHDYYSAALIEIKYLHNITAAVRLYCKDHYYDEAILLCSSESRLELIEEVVDPALGEGFGAIAELISDCDGQCRSQLRRLRELRAKKEEDPNGFYGSGADDADHPDNVSIAASETSTKESFFTRYTGKTSGTAKTGASRRTSKNRRREERKRARGKKGTIYEEEYLVKSQERLIERLHTTQPEARRLIEALLRRGMREQAYQTQKNFAAVMSFLEENVQEVFNISERDRERIDDDGLVYYVPEIPAPKITAFSSLNILGY